MTFRYQYGAGSNAYETLNPATPSELLGRYGIPDETEISKIFDRANTAQAEWARVPGLEPGERLNAFLDAVLCNRAHWEGVCTNTEKAIAEGAIALAGGSAADGAGEHGGYFYRPTVLGDGPHRSTAGQVEIFGPVLSVLEYDNFDQAMHMLNDTEFGLTSALFSNANDKVQQFLAESNNGMLHVNHGTVSDNNMPFGGIKHSGVGAYAVGPTVVNFYTSEHAAYVAW